MSTTSRLSVCLLGLAAMTLALPATKGWSTRYHVVKNFGADSSLVSLRFDSTWKSDDSLLARCMVKDSSLTTKSVQRDTAILLTDTLGKQTWSDYSCLFPWEPGGQHNWEDSKADLGKLTIRCTQEVTPPDRPVIGGSGKYRGLATGFSEVRDASPVLTVWDSGARAWSLLRDNTFGQEWRRLEPPIGPLQKNWEIGEAVPGFISLKVGDSWKWQLSTQQIHLLCKLLVYPSCMDWTYDTLRSIPRWISISVKERLPDNGYRQRWKLEINGQDSSQSRSSACEYSSFLPFGARDSLRCDDLPADWSSSANGILAAHHVEGWESPRPSNGFISRSSSIGNVCVFYCSKTTTTQTYVLTPDYDLDEYEYVYHEDLSVKFGGSGGTEFRTIQLMEKNGQTIRSTAIQPARRAVSPLSKALSPEQFHRALQQMPQVRELQIVGVLGTRQVVPVRQFLSWAEHHRGVHWITFAGSPRALQLLIP